MASTADASRYSGDALPAGASRLCLMTEASVPCRGGAVTTDRLCGIACASATFRNGAVLRCAAVARWLAQLATIHLNSTSLTSQTTSVPSPILLLCHPLRIPRVKCLNGRKSRPSSLYLLTPLPSLRATPGFTTPCSPTPTLRCMGAAYTSTHALLHTSMNSTLAAFRHVK